LGFFLLVLGVYIVEKSHKKAAAAAAEEDQNVHTQQKKRERAKLIKLAILISESEGAS
jgi:hypothetical protein